MQVLLIDLVRHKNELRTTTTNLQSTIFNVLLKKYFVLRPCTTGYHHLRCVLHELRDRQQARVLALARSRQHFVHPVKTGITRHGALMHAVLRQQPARSLVLHEDMREAMQQLQCARAVPMKEPLGGAEDRRDTIGRYAAFLQLPQVRRPELILHEDRHRGL